MEDRSWAALVVAFHLAHSLSGQIQGAKEAVNRSYDPLGREDLREVGSELGHVDHHLQWELRDAQGVDRALDPILVHQEALRVRQGGFQDAALQE